MPRSPRARPPARPPRCRNPRPLARLATLATILGLATGVVRAGTLSPELGRRLTGAPPDRPLRVLVFLEERAPLEAMRAAQKARGAGRRESHREIVESLQRAARSQRPLLESLRARGAKGGVEEVSAYWIANLLVVRARPAVIAEIAARADVSWLEPAFRVRLLEPVERPPGASSARQSGDPPGEDCARLAPGTNGRSGVPDGIRAIRAPRVWFELGLTGSGRLVANLDTGVDGGHPALRRRWRGARPGVDPRHAWFDPADSTRRFPFDPHGHGTHVLGTMTGLGRETGDTIGVAWGAEWIASNAIQADAGPGGGDPVVAAYQWFADPDGNPATVDDVPDVIQNSWGVAPDEEGYVPCDSRWWSVVDACEAAGAVVTWSAGNSGPGSATIVVPADRATSATSSFSVGAVRATGASFPYTLAGFSSRGPTFCTDDLQNRIKPEVVAPGVDIFSSVPGGGYAGGWSGTSMAGPHAAGIVALIREANPDLDAESVKTILLETARDLGRPGDDNDFGAGFVDAYAAVERALTGYGRIEGTVRNGSVEAAPLPGAVVRLLDTGRQFRSDALGRYSGAAMAGAYRLAAAAEGFAPDTAQIAIEAGEVARRDFLLEDNAGPWLVALDAPVATTDTIGPYRLRFEARDPSGIASVRVDYRVDAEEWNRAPAVPGNDLVAAEIPGAGPGRLVEYCAEAVDRAGLASLWPRNGRAEPASFQVRRRIYFDDFERAPALGWIAGAPGDAATAGHWTQAEPVAAYDGTRRTQPGRDHSEDPGTLCFVTGNAGPDAPAGEADVDGGCTTLISPAFDLSRETEVHASWWLWFGKGGASSDDTLRIDLSTDDGATWRPLERVFDPDTIWRFHTVRLAKATPLTRAMRFRFQACDLGQPGVTEAALDDVSLEAFHPPRPRPGPLPAVARLLPPVPSPCPGGCDLRFDLPSPGRVRLAIYDVLGREIRVAHDAEILPGRHAIPWNATDASGRRLPAGVYFLRMQAPGFRASRGLVIVQ